MNRIPHPSSDSAPSDLHSTWDDPTVWSDDPPTPVAQERPWSVGSYPNDPPPMPVAAAPADQQLPMSARILSRVAIGVAVIAVAVFIFIAVKNGGTWNLNRRSLGKLLGLGLFVALAILAAVWQGLRRLVDIVRGKR